MVTDSSGPIEAKVIYRLPASLSKEVGAVAVTYSHLEHKLTALIAMILQLQKPEARLVLDDPPIFDRLDTIQDLFALKGLLPDFPFKEFWEELKELNSQRNNIVHGIWLEHPETGKVWLRLTKGHWKRTAAHQPKVRRIIRPESMEMGAEQCKEVRLKIEAAIGQVDVLGGILDNALQTFPDRFRPPAPVVDPLARRSHVKPQSQRKASEA